MEKIAICTQGSIGILVIRKLFELGYSPEDIFVVTYAPQSAWIDIENGTYEPNNPKPLGDGNTCFLAFLDHYLIDYTYWENSQSLNVALISRGINLLLSFSWKYIFKAPLFRDDLIMINCHPGILPNYRGCFSIPWSIMNDDFTYGFTYHKIVEDIDAGEILVQSRLPSYAVNKSDITYSWEDNAFTLHFKVMHDAINHLSFLNNLKWFLSHGSYSKSTQWKYLKNQPTNYYPNEFPELDESWDDAKKERYKRACYFPPNF